MKAGTMDLMKTRRLCRMLGESQRPVAGLLTMLWQFAAKNSPCGDIGRFTDEEIAIAVDYDGDPSKLTEALVTCGWLDLHDQHRLIVHDWHDHAPTYVKGVAARKGGFVTERPSATQGCQPKVDDSGSATQGSSEATAESATQGGKLPILFKSSLTKSNQTNSSNEAGASVGSKRLKQNQPRFVKPTLEDVQAYCRERKNGIEGQDFIDHYDTVGWVVGKNRSPMRDWKAAVRTWEKRRKQEQPVSRVATADDLAKWQPTTGGDE